MSLHLFSCTDNCPYAAELCICGKKAGSADHLLNSTEEISSVEYEISPPTIYPYGQMSVQHAETTIRSAVRSSRAFGKLLIGLLCSESHKRADE